MNSTKERVSLFIVPAACNHRRGVSIDCQQLGCIAPARLDDWVAAKRRTQEEKGAPSPVTEFRRSIPVTTHVIYYIDMHTLLHIKILFAYRDFCILDWVLGKSDLASLVTTPHPDYR